MQPHVREFGSRFARHLSEGDSAAAWAMLADWVQQDVEPAELTELIGVERPVEFEVDGNRATYDELKEPDGDDLPTRPFDPRVTAANFRQWMCVQLIPDEEIDDAAVDVWMAVVEVDGQLRIGYLEATGAD
jgi:hypothetical protein